MNEKSELRLSKNIEPTNYDITLEPDLTNASFTGNVSINLKVNKKTNKMNFHANDLDIKNIELQLKNKKITFLGVTFKAGTDDMRESPALKLIPKLHKKVDRPQNGKNRCGNTQECSGNHEDSAKSYSVRNGLSKCTGEVELFTAMMNNVAIPKNIHAVI